MKKELPVVLAIIIILCSISSVSAGAADNTTYRSGYYSYIILEDDTARITECSGATSDQVIPSRLGGHTVSGIDGYAFNNLGSMKTATIPNTVTYVGRKAFYNCAELATVNISDSMSQYDTWSVLDCPKLRYINASGNNNYLASIDGVLYNKNITKLIKCPYAKDSISIPSTVNNIGSLAFEDCNNLTAITLPDSVTTLSESVFRNCTKLESVRLPSGITQLSGAFHGCSSLKSVSLPQSINRIGIYTFFGCKSLEKINLPKSVSKIESYTFEECSGLKEISFSSAVTSVETRAFMNCSQLTDVYFDGSQREWNAITIRNSDHGNDALLNANIHFLKEDDSSQILLGDADCNGFVTVVDASVIQRHLADLSLTTFSAIVSDVDNDGEVGITDATLIERYATGIPTQVQGIGQEMVFEDSYTVEFVDFYSDINDVLVGEETPVTFYAKIDSNIQLPAQSVNVYDENDTAISEMADDGENGDETANDGIFTATVSLQSDVQVIKPYHAVYEDISSAECSVSFYLNLTDEELSAGEKVLEALHEIASKYHETGDDDLDADNAMTSYNEIYDYLKTLLDNQTIVKYETADDGFLFTMPGNLEYEFPYECLLVSDEESLAETGAELEEFDTSSDSYEQRSSKICVL